MVFLAISTALRFAALILSIRVALRMKDWKVWVLPLLFAILAATSALRLINQRPAGPLILLGSDWPLITLVVSVAAVAAMYFLCRSITSIQRAEERLVQLNKELDLRVRERTWELEHANRELQREISERRRVEEERHKIAAHLQQAQKLEAIGRLAGGIAHDFNNILTSIIGFAALVEEDLPKDSAQRAHMREILTAGERARGLVKQILTFSRHGGQQRQPVEIASVVREALSLMRATVPTTIEIRQDMDEQCGTVLADPTQIHQIIVNLVTNAYEAIRDSTGTVAVYLHRAAVDPTIAKMHPTLKGGLHVRLTVSDTGCGMDRSVRERMFEPFFTAQESGRGTGLGLSMVHGIVTAHGGCITCHSEVGRGSSFNVYFPRLAQKIDQRSERREGVPAGTEYILFVDDEVAITQLAKEALQKMGYRVTSLTSSREALRVFRENPQRFDLVFLDVAMPQMSGVELGQALLKLRPDVPVILGTGFSEFISRHEAQRIGIRGFVMKPYRLEELGKTIRRVLDTTKGA